MARCPQACPGSLREVPCASVTPSPGRAHSLVGRVARVRVGRGRRSPDPAFLCPPAAISLGTTHLPVLTLVLHGGRRQELSEVASMPSPTDAGADAPPPSEWGSSGTEARISGCTASLLQLQPHDTGSARFCDAGSCGRHEPDCKDTLEM